ncbi:MAG: T9SS type A sorting domain-containing protein [Bacteroidetes bacterium]|nr:T9SS type A sorting domain-containing protein [Bacteroidota bacterium]
MPKFILFVFLLVSSWVSRAQVTLNVTLPANTPQSDSIYAAGNFNNWNPKSAAHRLEKEGSVYKLTLAAGTGVAEFKFTRGTWASVEATAAGNYIPNRTFTYTPNLNLNLSVAGWEDKKVGGGTGSTALANVKIISDTFWMPQLQRKRRVWIYLPNDYASSSKMYPVMYMQDGQNLFDNLTSFSGEWGIDETMSDMEKNGYSGCIVVGIDNGGAQRINEYSPFVNPTYGGGQGEAYASFLVQTLKPFIDKNYRSLPDRNNTLIGGSSMGAYIAAYAIVQYPEVFSRAAIFSPAYWFSDSLFQLMRSTTISEPIRIYQVSGSNESSSMVPLMVRCDSLLGAEGHALNDRKVVVKQDGAHSEWFWKREFPAAFNWLLLPATQIDKALVQKLQTETKVYPNPAQDVFSIKAVEAMDSIQLIDKMGIVVYGKILNQASTRIDVSDFARGNYIILVHAKGVYYTKKVTLD